MSEFTPIVNNRELLLLGEGDTAICTLWTPKERWKSLMANLAGRVGSLYDPERVSVVGNLYDPKGVLNILRNLYANPHMKKLFIVGSDMSKNLVSTLKKAFYDTVSVPVKDKKDPVECSLGWLSFGEFSDGTLSKDDGRITFLEAQKLTPPEKSILTPPEFECVSLETPVPGTIIYGKDLREVWDRLRYYIQKFGTRYESRYGNTLEILGMTTVVPSCPYDERLPFSEEEGQAYADFLLDFNIKPEVSYDYGPLIGGIMDIDKEQFSTRHAYWPVYAPSHRGTKEPPCLVSCWFKERFGVLHGCYVFRSQDMFAGYTRNVYGLHKFQNILAEKHGFRCGPIVTQTHSAHLYERDVDLSIKYPKIMDPAGDCIISVEKDCIQVDIVREGETIQRLTGRSHRVLEDQLSHYVSDISHAMYLGRELYKAEVRLRGSSVENDEV